MLHRNVLSPALRLTPLAGFAAPCESPRVHFSTQATSRTDLLRSKPHRHPSRIEAQHVKLSKQLRSGAAKCTMKRAANAAGAAAVLQVALVARLSANPAGHSPPQQACISVCGTDSSEGCWSEEEVADRTVTTLGLQASML